jgi:outer membrane autotransporter protein
MQRVKNRPSRRHGVIGPFVLRRLSRVDRSSLLVTTAVASTLLVGSLLAPAPAVAADNDCPDDGTPILLTATAPIICINTEDITATAAAEDAVNLSTTGDGNSIYLYNSGELTSYYGDGIDTRTTGDDAPITIENEGDIAAGTFGIYATTAGANSGIEIDNDGDITAALNDPTIPPSAADGIYAFTSGGNSPISIENEGDITVYGAFVPLPPPDQAYSAGVYDGIYAVTVGQADEANPDTPAYSPIQVVNKGDITTAYGEAIDVRTYGGTSPFIVTPDMDVPYTVGRHYSPVTVINHGDIYSDDDGIEVCTAGLRYTNCRGGGGNSPVLIKNYGNINAAYVPLDAVTYGPDSPITFYNYGDVVAGEEGLDAESSGDGSSISITNRANVEAEGDGISAATSAYAQGDMSPITIFNTGDIYSGEVGIYASTGQNYESNQSPVNIHTSGEIVAGYHGIYAHTDGFQSPIYIENRGEIIGGENEDGEQVGTCVISDEEPFDRAGICAAAEGDDSDIRIVNYGSITAESLLAIGTVGGPTEILNAGLIEGFVVLNPEGDTDDRFINKRGGTFEARDESDFGPGDDLFRNEKGGTVQTAGDYTYSETTSFINLERFENKGLISLQDDEVGDTFCISNDDSCVPVMVDGSDLEFVASGNSTLEVDAFLGGPGSTADNFIIDGDVSGRTALSVFNTNPSGGVFNPDGIPVVFVTGEVDGNAFFLPKPIDAGFFNYDLFFEPGNGLFELRSFLGGGAFVLPQLITAAQDLWHAGSDTWFDRTADLRALLKRGTAAEGYPANLKDGKGASGTVTPGLWVRGSTDWLSRDDSERVTAYGRNYRYDLERDLATWDVQFGIDLGARGLLTDNDMLVFGPLGGFVHGDLHYDNIGNGRDFDINGPQVGGYATYLRGGLFVDTLLNVHFLDVETQDLGFPQSFDATNVGLRTDGGYRFGSYKGGAFIEPLATLSINWADIDGFSVGGNKVSFDDDANVRGRLGLRVGTSFTTADGMTIEPFLIGSVWGNFTDTNKATLVSNGTAFGLEDELDDVWGEVSAGLNFFPSPLSAVFAKVDVSFGDDMVGVGAKFGARAALHYDSYEIRGLPSTPDAPRGASYVCCPDCCADLRERVAELEATTVRRGNPGLKMSFAGTVSHAILSWDDGARSDAYVVGNDNDGSSFEIVGEVEHINNSLWSAGYVLEVGMLTSQSSEVNQLDARGGDVTLEVNESHMWVRNDPLGQVSWGFIGGSDRVDDPTEFDLSETRVVAFSGVEDVGGNFFIRRAGTKGIGGLTPVVWADLIDHLPGVDGPLVRYDLPTTRGLGGWAEAGRDGGPIWEFVLSYGDPATLEEEEEAEEEPRVPPPPLIKGLQIAGAISHFGIAGDEDLPDNRNVSGSASVLHEASGLNFTFAGGRRIYTQSVELNDGTLGKPQDASFYYIKPGLLLNHLIEAGHTAFYAEHGKWHDFLGRNADAETVAGLVGLFSEEEVCAFGQACLVSGSEATIWGFGVVQKIDSAEMELYIGFRHYKADIALTDDAGAKIPSVALDDFMTVMTGAVIEF